MAWFSTAGFHHKSKSTTLDAQVKFNPTPHALRLARSTNGSLLLLLLLLIFLLLALEVVELPGVTSSPTSTVQASPPSPPSEKRPLQDDEEQEEDEEDGAGRATFPSPLASLNLCLLRLV